MTIERRTLGQIGAAAETAVSNPADVFRWRLLDYARRGKGSAHHQEAGRLLAEHGVQGAVGELERLRAVGRLSGDDARRIVAHLETAGAARAPEAIARPFLRWAGGKRWAVDLVLESAPASIQDYFEPFLGGGSMFFALRAAGRLQGRVTLADRNAALIEAWQIVRDAPAALIRAASGWVSSRAGYYHVRDEITPDGPVEAAARLLWLNRNCFNGLYRLNRSGKFNVPFGRHRKPRNLEAENIHACSAALQGVRLVSGDFEAVVGEPGPGAFVFLDPPYKPISKTSNFTAYDGGAFGDDDQARVAALAGRLSAAGVPFVAHNSSAARDIWEAVPGIAVVDRDVRRSINSKGDGRGRVTEIVARRAAA